MDPEQLICAVLRGEATPWRLGVDAAAVSHFLEAARYHGVLPLLDLQFRTRDDFHGWPAAVLKACHEETLGRAMYDLAHRAEIVHVLDALASAGVRPLLLKGTQLAYSHYPNPALRHRSDTDLLIPPEQQIATRLVLNQLGYSTVEGMEGELVSYQASWSRKDRLGVTHVLDVHWRINNSQILAKLMSYDELAAHASPAPALGPNANALAPVDALLFGCIHRAGHARSPFYIQGFAHPGGDRLIWLYDLHLLASRMSAQELEHFAAVATSKRIKAICADALQRTVECFTTAIPQRVFDILRRPGPFEPSARYFSGGSMMRQMLGDFLALERWSDRIRWARESAFPSARYMRSKYPDAPDRWLPMLYARRGLAGVARLISSAMF